MNIENNFSLNNNETLNEKTVTDYEQKQTYSIDDDLLVKDILKHFLINNINPSASYIQRKYQIGYSRAIRILDIMYNLGFISNYEGIKPRKLLITKEKFEKMFGEKI